MSLETQNIELQIFFEPKKKEQNKKYKKNKNDILFLDPLYFQQLYLAHFSFILNDFKGYKCTISKSIQLVESEKSKKQ
jgi:hypothetical protein